MQHARPLLANQVKTQGYQTRANSLQAIDSLMQVAALLSCAFTLPLSIATFTCMLAGWVYPRDKERPLETSGQATCSRMNTFLSCLASRGAAAGYRLVKLVTRLSSLLSGVLGQGPPSTSVFRKAKIFE